MKGTEFEKTVFVGNYISNPNNYYLNNKLKKNSKGPGMTTTAKESTYGKNAVLKGMNLQEGGTTIERNRQIGGHKE